jgi:hypothetical protein
MQREPPDSQFYDEIRDLNFEFLVLVTEGRTSGRGMVFGLDTAVVEQIGRFRQAQLAAVAATPCLLAGFGAGPNARVASLVAEPAPGCDSAWLAKARLFAAGLLTYAWQMSRRDSLRSALCAGPAAASLAGSTSFGEMRARADQALQRLEARFCDRTRFWPDLVRAAREGHAERLSLARLTAIQLATCESLPKGAYAAPSLRTGTAGMR